MTPSFSKVWDVAVVGEIYVDHVFNGFEAWPAPGEEVATDSYTREVGGGAAATACGLARLGRSVNLLGLVGFVDAAWFETRFAQFGVSTHGLRGVDGQTGVTVAVSTAQDRSFFTHIGVNRLLSAELVGAATVANLARARHVHFAMPLARTAADTLLPALKAAGCTTSLDAGYQPAWFADPDNAWTLRAFDHLMPNEKEAALLCGEASAEAYLAFARREGFGEGLMKLGAQGAAAWDGEAICQVAPPPVTVRDTTGAGDAFDAGFIDGLLDAAGVRERLQRACICGALSTRAAGALGGLPDKPELWSAHERTYGS